MGENISELFGKIGSILERSEQCEKGKEQALEIIVGKTGEVIEGKDAVKRRGEFFIKFAE